MKVFIAIWEDRHTDVEVAVFSSEQAAITWASALAREHDRHGVLDETLTERMREGGWLYFARYSDEGDSVRVEAKMVDGDD